MPIHKCIEKTDQKTVKTHIHFLDSKREFSSRKQKHVKRRDPIAAGRER